MVKITMRARSTWIPIEKSHTSGGSHFSISECALQKLIVSQISRIGNLY